MNYLETQLQTWTHAPFAKALGWSLIHFLWEGVVLALLLAVLLYLSRGASARFRYGIACVALLAMPVALAFTIVVSAPPNLAPQTHASLAFPQAPPADAGNLAQPTPNPGLKAILPWVPLFWMTGVLVFYVRTLGGWMVTRRLQRAGVSAASPAWQARLESLCRRVGLAQTVVLLESCLVDVPVIMGFLRPVVLMPVGLMSGLTTDQLECILIHELAHIRRWDYVVNLLQNLVEGLLFYHPAVWWVSAQVRAEREDCCDDVVVHLKGDARGYAAALATLEQTRWPAQQPALAATGGSLMKRIRRLLQEPPSHRTPAAPVFVAGLLLVSVGVALASWETQTPPIPAVRIATSATAPLRVISHTAPLPPEPRVAAPHINKPLVQLVAEATPPQDPVPQARPLTPRQEERNEQKLQQNLETPFRKWLTEDVAYIISNEERSAFKKLSDDIEREHFIEQFWLRRDPTPGTPENEMREEHYRRIAYTNEHFSSAIPGWKTDRGRIYIVYGPPDEIESHPTGGNYQRPASEGGGSINTVPFEQWRYRWIDGLGTNVIVEFVDPEHTGEYHMTKDPSEKDASHAISASTAKLGVTAQVMSTPTSDGGKAVLFSIPLGVLGGRSGEVRGEIRTVANRPVSFFTKGLENAGAVFTQLMPLKPGTYTFRAWVRDRMTGLLAADEITFEVK